MVISADRIVIIVKPSYHRFSKIDEEQSKYFTMAFILFGINEPTFSPLLSPVPSDATLHSELQRIGEWKTSKSGILFLCLLFWKVSIKDNEV